MADERGKCELPLSRVKTIMKSSPDVGMVNQEALFLTAKATPITKREMCERWIKAFERPEDDPNINKIKICTYICIKHFIGGKEMFIQSLAQVSLEQSTDKKIVKYNDLAEIVDSIDTLQFLQDIIPKKIKVKEYLEIMKKLEEERESTET